jgi:hypothetical protein
MALYKTAKGKVIDMARLASQNELAVAVSNVRINARGDELGPGGQIIRKQPDVPHVPSTGTPVEIYSAPVQTARPIIKEQPKVQPALTTPAPVFEPIVESVASDFTKANNNKGKQ